MITTITGPQGSGKTTMAKALINGRSFVEIMGSDVEDLTTDFFKAKDIDVLLIEEVLSVDQVDFIITSQALFQGIRSPDIIIVSSVLDKSDFKPYAVKKLLHCLTTMQQKNKTVPYSLYKKLFRIAFASALTNVLLLIYFFCKWKHLI